MIINVKRLAIQCSIVTCTLLLLSLIWIRLSLLLSLENSVNRELQELVPNKVFSGADNNEMLAFMQQNLVVHLNQVQVNSFLPVVGEVTVTTLSSTETTASMFSRFFFKEVEFIDPIHHQKYLAELEYTLNWANLFAFCGALSLFFTGAVHRLPRPLDERTMHQINQLAENGYSREKARRIAAFSPSQQFLFETALKQSSCEASHDELLAGCERQHRLSLTTRQQTWFVLSIKEHCFETALSNACKTPEKIRFLPATKQLFIHEHPVHLAPTPYFYYLWYAQKKCQDSNNGWVLNIPSNKQDMPMAEELIALMQRYGGHGKAINDLERNGLTSKKLDQNRNKIKDEITATLGERLAEPYLFESMKDVKTGRSLYRVRMEKNRIEIV